MKQTGDGHRHRRPLLVADGVSDFVANLEASGYFKRSIEIVSTTSEPMPQPPGELIKFSIKAEFQQPGDAKAPAPQAAAGATQ